MMRKKDGFTVQFQKNAVYGIVKYITVIVRNGIAVGITKNEK